MEGDTRMMKHRRLLAGTLTAAMVVSMAGNYKMLVYAQEAPSEKQYVIVADDEIVYDQVVEEVGDGIVTETPVLSENNIIVAEMTLAEAKVLSAETDVWMEEDIILSGSTLEDANAEKVAEKIRREAEITDTKAEEDIKEESEYEWNLQAVNADEIVTEEKNSQKRK